MAIAKIQLLNPNPLIKGALIDEDRYEIVKKCILDVVDERGMITFKELMGEVKFRLNDVFAGSPSWYCTAVKLDLEAKGVLERIGATSPQRIKRAAE